MTPRRLAALGGLLLGGAALALVPVRHRVRLESDPANPLRHLRVESRSLLGLRRTGWGVRVAGVPAWGNAAEGFFLVPAGEVQVAVLAWPWFRQSVSIPAGGAFQSGLREEGDREAFRAWFVALLEQQLEGPSPAWEPAQRDCAGLMRFAFREALAPHTQAWRDRVGYTDGTAGGDPSPAFGRAWRAGFPTPEGVQPFAKGAFLRRYACVPMGRDLALARSGDLIFFARGGARPEPDHVMAFVRPDSDGTPVLLYDTGPEGTGTSRQPGEVRRVRLEDLLHHPDPEFRPLAENPAFLGLYRWQLLASRPADPAAPRS